MKRACVRIAAQLSLLWVTGCNDSHGAERVGDECTPETIPSSPSGRGFSATDSFLETTAQCGSDVCVVHRLDNGSDGGLPADPTLLCDASDPRPGCVTPRALEQSVHCSCRCDGPDPHARYCTCPDKFLCRELVSTGPLDVRGSYCVRPAR